MRTHIIFLVFLLCLAACRSEDIKDTPNVYEGPDMPEVHLSVSQKEWDRLLSEFDKDKNTKEFVCCAMRFRQGEEVAELDNVGLRLKGNTSRRRPQEGSQFHHVHFGINTNQYQGNQSALGIRRFDLKWFKDDATYVREVYCYDLFRRFGVWTTIRDVYSRLWLKVGDKEEMYYGVYGLMEHVNREYLERRAGLFGSTIGNIWKCNYGADLKSIDADMGQDDNVHEHVYERKTGMDADFPKAKAQLQDFISNLNNLQGTAFREWISSVMDVDLFLRTYAVNVAVGMWDDYWNNSNNYYLYFNSQDEKKYKLFFIPYDYDNTLGTSHNCGVQSDSGRHDPLNWGDSSRPLVSRIIAFEDWRALYVQYLKELCTGLSSPQQAEERIRLWQNSIKDFVQNDTGEDCTLGDSPASWGNHEEYRLQGSNANNFFVIKAAAVAKL